MISFISAQGLVKIRLACSKPLLLTISSSDIVTHSLLENCTYSELFCPYSVQMRENTDQNNVE